MLHDIVINKYRNESHSQGETVKCVRSVIAETDALILSLRIPALKIDTTYNTH